MIKQILKKDYDLIQRRRSFSKSQAKLGVLVFKGADSKYYQVDGSGMSAVKEWLEYNKRLKSGIDSQGQIL